MTDVLRDGATIRHLTGPEHFRLAENLLAGTYGWTDEEGTAHWEEPTEHELAAANAHATLALAAATAGGGYKIPHGWRRIVLGQGVAE